MRLMTTIFLFILSFPASSSAELRWMRQSIFGKS